jgi:tRNA threonylcarbamoyladenosine biosynthesis protein TsaE
MVFTTNSLSDSKRFASAFAQKLRKVSRPKGAMIFTLFGDLGAGKTTFVKYVVSALGSKARVSSPTFVLMRRYRAGDRMIHHIDCYRITTDKESEMLGISTLFKDPTNILFIEWPERISLPGGAIPIVFTHGKTQSERTISTRFLLRRDFT